MTIKAFIGLWVSLIMLLYQSRAEYALYYSPTGVSWETARSICRRWNMSLPVLNVTEVSLLVQKYPQLDGLYLWSDGKCSWKNLTFEDVDAITVSDTTGDKNCLALECYGLYSFRPYCKVIDLNCKSSIRQACNSLGRACPTNFTRVNDVCYSNAMYLWNQTVCNTFDDDDLSGIRLPQGSYWFGQGQYSCQSGKGENLDVIFRESLLGNESCFSFFYKAPYKFFSEAKDCRTFLTKYIVCEATLNPTNNGTGSKLDDKTDYQATTPLPLTCCNRSIPVVMEANNISTPSVFKENMNEQAIRSDPGSYIGYGFLIGMTCGILSLTAVYFFRRCFKKKYSNSNNTTMNKVHFAKSHIDEGSKEDQSSKVEKANHQNYVNSSIANKEHDSYQNLDQPPLMKVNNSDLSSVPTQQTSLPSDEQNTAETNYSYIIEPEQSAGGCYETAHTDENDYEEANLYHTLEPDQA